jgi:transcriptional regulator with XRE-family HTH domain
MPAAALRAWRTEMGLAERDAAERLGMSRGGLRNAEADGAPLYIALACAALKANLMPYGQDDDGEWTFD